MSKPPSLRVVEDDRESSPPAPVESASARIRRLQTEIKAASREQILTLLLTMSLACEYATAIAEGGDAYPPGVRDLARRFVEDCETRAQTLEAITARTP